MYIFFVVFTKYGSKFITFDSINYQYLFIASSLRKYIILNIPSKYRRKRTQQSQLL